jgi:ABC-type polysaccharide/polyol phosphate export permease
MAIYPLRTALGGTIHFMIALVVVIVLATIGIGFPGIVPLISLIPTIVLLCVFTWGLAALAGLANVYFQDTQHLTEVGFQIMFYATPVMYPPKVLRENGLSWLADYNPLVPLLQMIREPILEKQAPSLATFSGATLTVLLTTMFASYCLSRLQSRLIFQL